jgi:hypothetical protein
MSFQSQGTSLTCVDSVDDLPPQRSTEIPSSFNGDTFPPEGTKVPRDVSPEEMLDLIPPLELVELDGMEKLEEEPEYVAGADYKLTIDSRNDAIVVDHPEDRNEYRSREIALDPITNSG